MTRKEAEAKFNQQMEKDEEFAKVFKEHPEKKESYIEKLIDSDNEVWGCRGINPKYCQTCRYSHGKPPFEDLPNKAYCMIYTKDEGEGKPPEVYYDGEECEFYKESTVQ